MPDSGHELEFGFFRTPEAADPAGVLATAQLLDALGYDFIGIQDPPYQPRFLDALALLAYVLAQTARVRVFPAVANLALRPPALLAKEAASLDRLSGGRFELALGTGGFQQVAATMGGAVRSPGEQRPWRPLRRELLPARRAACGPDPRARRWHLDRRPRPAP